MKILHIDIETAPNTAQVWGLWNQNVGLNQLMESGYTLCWAAKWHGEKPIYFRSIHKDGVEAMVAGAHALLDEADAVVHYNGIKFDIPTLNKEFVLNGMTPPSTYKQIDLLRVARSKFRFPSNKLEYVANALGVGKKVKHEGHTLWVKCMAGDRKAWKNMEIYNRQDTLLLEDLYLKLLPWIDGHPNVNLYADATGVLKCPKCGGSKLQKRGFAYTNVSKFQRYQCTSCGGWSRGRKNLQDRDGIVLNAN